MATYKANSWGRTRGPKNLGGPNATAVDVYSNTNGLKGITATEVGYLTENQRYLHVLVETAYSSGGALNPGAVTVFGYCHAFQRWFEIGASTLDTTIAEAAANTAPTGASIDPASSAATPATQVPSAREYRRYDILGIDRVAFVNGTPTEVNVFAACSTF